MYEEAVLDIIKKEPAFMASVSGERPRIRPMKAFVDEFGHIWLFSRFDSKKVEELSVNPRVELAFMGKDDSVVTLFGQVKDETKPGTPQFRLVRDAMLNTIPEMKNYFGKNEEDKIVLYQLVVHEVNYMLPDRTVTSRVNLPMTYNPEVEVTFCKGGFCLIDG
ncbi:hypothetical protein AB840_11955 [Megasphaera cerevisiae DSM 20462]|uniref:Pyridoxamine 5'-phosphate oxidase N-terminal domain-containing protein n=1 Tax=Megasphaera cerevisiae DSM 20462 TaxID=1122219 RepID=A0A0J6ZLI9_9FIRM|nr:pyridoxamine 5'-phosphate oxidase family protein [Megasphaera cerevisiae]KMO85736.1 hypothetical protein AB840_11955 [Megasphaera cerevisiae DSM 20462]OKY53089.1 hypothetical protein BSR42_09470 [Megasphaera cerevisiae]SJZ96075.1 General stress protein 26 [Megasphaera cerevisiae DSM 20462]